MLEVIILGALVITAIRADVASLAMLRGVKAAGGGIARLEVALRVTAFEVCALPLGWLIGGALSSYDSSLARWIGHVGVFGAVPTSIFAGWLLAKSRLRAVAVFWLSAQSP